MYGLSTYMAVSIWLGDVTMNVLVILQTQRAVAHVLMHDVRCSSVAGTHNTMLTPISVKARQLRLTCRQRFLTSTVPPPMHSRPPKTPARMQAAGYTRVLRGVHLMSVGCVRPRWAAHPPRHSTCQRTNAHTMSMRGMGLSTSNQYCRASEQGMQK